MRTVTELEIRAVVVDDLEPQGQHRPVALQREFAVVDAVGTVVVAAGGVVDAVFDVLHRAARGARKRGGERHDLVREELGAEAAAGHARNDVELRRRHAERCADQPADVVEKGAVRVERELAAAGLERRDRAGGLERLSAGATPAEAALHDEVGLREIILDRTIGVGVAVRDVRQPTLRMQHRIAAGADRGLRIDDHRQILILDLDEIARVLSNVAALGDDRHDRLSDVSHAIDGNAVLHHRRARELCGRPGNLLRVFAGHDQNHTGERFRLRGVDAFDPRVRPVAAQHCRMRHLGHDDVVDVLPMAGEQARVLDALQVLADPLVRLLWRLLLPARRDVALGGDVLGDGRGHLAPSFIKVTACWMDSTML